MNNSQNGDNVRLLMSAPDDIMEKLLHRIIEIEKNVAAVQATDSIEIGTPGKKGCIKVYGNFGDPIGFHCKIDAAIEVMKVARGKLETE